MKVQDLKAFAENPAFAAQASDKYQELMTRSAVDRAFRNKLLADPRAAIAEFSGRDISQISQSLNVKFVENTAAATIVLPDPVDSIAELSDAELEAVAGGTSVPCIGVLASLLWVSAEIVSLIKETISN